MSMDRWCVLPQSVAQAVPYTNEWSGVCSTATACNVWSVTGNTDPWSELAIVPRMNSSNDTMTNNHSLVHPVVGASHHFRTHPSKETDDAVVQTARGIIYQVARGWEDPAILQAVFGHGNGKVRGNDSRREAVLNLQHLSWPIFGDVIFRFCLWNVGSDKRHGIDSATSADSLPQGFQCTFGCIQQYCKPAHVV